MFRVLIVDDEPDILEVLRCSLEYSAGWKILTAGSGAQAIQLAVEQQPDAVILDARMPVLDGPATFQVLKDTPATVRIPVVLLTGLVSYIDRKRFLVMGFAGVVAKPFDPMTIADVIRRELKAAILKARTRPSTGEWDRINQ